MAVKRKNDVDVEEALAGQIPEYNEPETVNDATTMPEEDERPKNAASQFLGTKLGHVPGEYPGVDKVKDSTLAERKHLSRVGDNIFARKNNSDYREGWLDVDRELLGERNKFYPEGWRFKIKPAEVEAIRNWSVLNTNSTNYNAIDDVFNEILKWCLAIEDENRNPISWNHINSWDRFFFVLLIREYTFQEGEKKVAWSEECVNCDSLIEFNLNSQSLMYDLPDAELLPYFDANSQSWMIDPQEFEVDYEPIMLYLPTVEKEANIKAWIINKLQQNPNAKIDSVFIRFLHWIAPKISKDLTIAQRQIREYETKFKLWDTEMFAFMDNVLRNIEVTPSTRIKTICPSCGEEVTSEIRFPNGVSDLFSMGNKFKKFGKK